MMSETLRDNLKNCQDNLFRLIEKFCWNKVSQNCLYILSDFNEFNSTDCKNNIRRTINSKKIPRDFDFVIQELEREYSDLYDIAFYLFKAKRNSSIIEIQYYRKSNFDEEYYKTVKDNPPMFHAKISRPMYVGNENKKFDVNWESLNIRHNFNLLIYRWKYH